ncbi:MAG: TonB-dependent receptor, partial [Bacteroidota bacterium]
MEYTPKNWSVILTGNYQGNMYIDYYNTEIETGKADLSKIKKTDPFMLFNARIARDMKNFKIYGGVNNIFNYVQDERYLDDAAFMYAPVYGTMFYAGVSVDIMH